MAYSYNVFTDELDLIVKNIDELLPVAGTAWDIIQHNGTQWQASQNLSMLGTGNIYIKKDNKVYFDA